MKESEIAHGVAARLAPRVQGSRLQPRWRSCFYLGKSGTILNDLGSIFEVREFMYILYFLRNIVFEYWSLNPVSGTLIGRGASVRVLETRKARDDFPYCFFSKSIFWKLIIQKTMVVDSIECWSKWLNWAVYETKTVQSATVVSFFQCESDSLTVVRRNTNNFYEFGEVTNSKTIHLSFSIELLGSKAQYRAQIWTNVGTSPTQWIDYSTFALIKAEIERKSQRTRASPGFCRLWPRIANGCVLFDVGHCGGK